MFEADKQESRCKDIAFCASKTLHFCRVREMENKFSNLLLTPDPYSLMKGLSQQALINFCVRNKGVMFVDKAPVWSDQFIDAIFFRLSNQIECNFYH